MIRNLWSDHDDMILAQNDGLCGYPFNQRVFLRLPGLMDHVQLTEYTIIRVTDTR